MTYDFDTALRPTSWDEYQGQAEVKERLEIAIKSSIAREQPMSNVLLAGAPGVGKSSLAAIIAARLGDPFLAITMPIKPAAMMSHLKRFAVDGGVLFLDEFHRLKTPAQEDLLTLLEDKYATDRSGRRIVFGWLTVIMATTEPQLLLPTIKERTAIQPRFGEYSKDELGLIVQGLAKKAEVEIDTDVATQLGTAAGGSPRMARNLVLAWRELSDSEDPTVERTLKICQVAPDGLSKDHVDYLQALQDLGGTAGETLLTNRLRIHKLTLLHLERLLLDLDLVSMSPQGREMTPEAYKRLGTQSHTPGRRPRAAA